MEIRRPTKSIAPEYFGWIVENFYKEIEYPIAPDLLDCHEFCRQNYNRMFFFVGFHGGVAVGGISSVVSRHPFNSQVKSSNEMFFWIKPGARGTRLPILMLRAHEEWIERENITIPSLTLLESSPESLVKVYEKMGYKETERLFAKWRQ